MADLRTPLALFDLDDTLCDYVSARDLRLWIAFQEAAGQLAEDLLARMVSESIATQPHGVDHFPELFAAHGLDPASAGLAIDWYRSNRFHGLRLFDDAVPVLAELRARGHRLGIITNGPAEVQRAKVDLLGVEPLVDFVIISGEFGVAKPDPRIFREALRLGRASEREALHVGDSLEFDIAGASATGIRTAWVNRHGAARTAADPEPDHVVRTASEALALITGERPRPAATGC